MYNPETVITRKLLNMKIKSIQSTFDGPPPIPQFYVYHCLFSAFFNSYLNRQSYLVNHSLSSLPRASPKIMQIGHSHLCTEGHLKLRLQSLCLYPLDKVSKVNISYSYFVILKKCKNKTKSLHEINMTN